MKRDLRITVPDAGSVQTQVDAANSRLMRAHRAHIDNEYAEGVRDALSWVLGLCRAPFNNNECEEHHEQL